MARTLWLRLAAALVAFGAVHVYMSRELYWPIASRIIELGEACGMHVTRLGGQFPMPHPFFGEGGWVAVWNYVFDHGPRVWILAVSWAVAAGVFWLTGYRRAAPARDGKTRCGACGYVLEGLKEPRCPECGRAI